MFLWAHDSFCFERSAHFLFLVMYFFMSSSFYRRTQLFNTSSSWGCGNVHIALWMYWRKKKTNILARLVLFSYFIIQQFAPPQAICLLVNFTWPWNALHTRTRYVLVSQETILPQEKHTGNRLLPPRGSTIILSPLLAFVGCWLRLGVVLK